MLGCILLIGDEGGERGKNTEKRGSYRCVDSEKRANN